MRVTPITPAIGVEIEGVDASLTLSVSDADQLRSLWVTHKLLVFRNQTLDPGEQFALTSLFGEIEKYPFLDGIRGHPLISPVLKLPDEDVNFGGVWHSDTSYLPQPAAGASLYAVDLPPHGGDTIFSNMALAYRCLEPETQERIASMRAVNSSSKAAVARTRGVRNGKSTGSYPEYSAIHPVVRTHPVTGEQSLFVNEAHTTQLVGYAEQESNGLLKALVRHAQKPEFQCRLRWRAGTLIVWDNRATQHYPVNDYHGHRRLLHRISIRGDTPV